MAERERDLAIWLLALYLHLTIVVAKRVKCDYLCIYSPQTDVRDTNMTTRANFKLALMKQQSEQENRREQQHHQSQQHQILTQPITTSIATSIATPAAPVNPEVPPHILEVNTFHHFHFRENQIMCFKLYAIK